MEPSESAATQPLAAPAAMDESAVSKLEISEPNTQSVSAMSNPPQDPPAMPSVESITATEPSREAPPLQNGVGGAHTNNAPETAAPPVPQIPDASLVPAISAILDDIPDAQTGGQPGVTQPVAQLLPDPVVQAETSSLRSTTPPPAIAVATSSEPQDERTKDHAPGVDTAMSEAPVAQELTPPAEMTSAKPVEPAGESHSEPQPTSDLPHRSPAGQEAPVPEETSSLAVPPQALLSQPSAVEPTESQALTASPSAAATEDHAMADAPASPMKIARSRDDESEDEPATKRMKAEDSAATDLQMEDAPPPAEQPPTQPDAHTTGEQVAASETSASGESKPAGPPQPHVPRTFNPDYDQPITLAQKKVLQRILTNVKRGPHAASFKEPVDPVKHNIPTYFDLIKNPMDLSTMEKKIKNSEYSAVNEFLADFDLIVQNCETFNGPVHSITQHGYDMRRSFDKQVVQIPSTTFVEPAPLDKKGPRRVSTETPKPQRRESRSSVGNAKSPTAGSPASPAFALQPSGIPVIRRDSNAGDGRPRREIHPPAPKDLPYSAQKPKKKKFQWELKFCQEIVNEFKKPKYQGSSWPFLLPVDPVAMNIPTYHKIIKKPMDLGTMEQKLKTGQYENAKEFEVDMRQIFFNCFKFNVSGDAVYKAGQSLEKLFDDKMETKKQWIKDHAPSSSVVSPESSAEGSDDDDDEDEDDDEEEEEMRKKNQLKIVELEAQILNLGKELQDLRKGSEIVPKKKPRPKAGGSKAKDSKKKAKAEKKSSGGKPKKAKELPYVTYEQKSDISERINSLPAERMAAALAIIRNNMPNLRGEDDEIELDIDELPNEVLHKLLNFVRKYAPRAEDPPEVKRENKPAASTKPKKNKPMGKVEQEARIKELREKLQGAGSDESGGQAAADDSSDDDDDSEESEED